MAMPTALKALTLLFVLAVLAPDQSEGRHHRRDCPSFSCGPHGNVSSPFRRASDPPGCGYKSYELVCSDTKAIIRIRSAPYYVSGINYNDATFWVLDADLDLYSSCPLPQWNPPSHLTDVNQGMVELSPVSYTEACFVDNEMYVLVACLSTNDSFVYVLTGYGVCGIEYLELSCGYLSMTRLTWEVDVQQPLYNVSYADVVKSMRSGFAIRFPYPITLRRMSFDECLFLWTLYVLAPLSVLIFLAYKYWQARITIDAVERFLRMQQVLGPRRYAYTDITAITGHFRDKLGQGGYGSVYKGVLLPGNVHVAIKMLVSSSNCNGEDFISQVSTIGRIHHVNVVRLVGFCPEELRQALVYEYMSGGSLDKGIDYLHQGCEMQILHFDIKPHNILLDSNFVPKIADFGLAKLYPRDNSFVPSRALRGTIGYIAPEMISRSFGVISSKSDVYSFGMLLLEMAGGRRNADPNAANSSQSYYPSWVYDKLTAPVVDAICPVASMHELEKKLCIVGLWCIQMKSHDRPTMSEVIDMLEGGFDGLQMPSRPFFCDDDHTAVPDSYPLLSELTEISEEDDE
ncbi:rust resistance kinase Lr10-like [Hordeum vulgare subsp. vulgare]|uniref:rust resistance kinase Lr10-like n=1 Tax=Hordeum vulgare subsp. vulgare TaxID=112509 RepID=UPI001D1A35FC|nr:rust resistance kinase Lr10-like [Hordeum vulgare subsp. vulgare]XP_044962641.1 rust resistance kinase Lr10-like [Hordeum vulgare subsp. vulgare]XP_044971766.1 rust resistance kinase Lr10-like [Hordeum vulgare subsp. vulgare]